MAEGLIQRESPLTILKRKSIYLAIASAIILSSGQYGLRVLISPGYANRWFILTAGGVAYLVYIFRKLLPLNQKQGTGGEILPVLGPGTVLTISRGILVSMLAGFLFSPWPQGGLAWVPALLYWLANLTDFLDGFIARRTNYETRLGEALDMALDGYGVLVAAILVVQFGQVPVWYLPVGLARYIFLLGIWVRKQAGKPVNELPPSIRRRAFAGLQMGFLGIMLMPLFTPPGTYWAAGLFTFMFLAGFLLDWLYLSGAVTSEQVGHLLRSYAVLFRGSIFSLRIITVGLLAWTIAEKLRIAVGQTGVLPGTGSALNWAWFIILEGFLFLLLVTGSAGRLAALAVLLLQGIYQLAAPLSVQQLLLILASAAVFFLGTGPISLWTPEDRLIYRRAGAR